MATFSLVGDISGVPTSQEGYYLVQVGENFNVNLKVFKKLHIGDSVAASGTIANPGNPVFWASSCTELDINPQAEYSTAELHLSVHGVAATTSPSHILTVTSNPSYDYVTKAKDSVFTFSFTPTIINADVTLRWPDRMTDTRSCYSGTVVGFKDNSFQVKYSHLSFCGTKPATTNESTPPKAKRVRPSE
ncbi:hypothetical protein HDU79_001458 [Rhizoclosmatium sp. JEL0117]|nr:hypothetical protein HDU79_001458 [Rhizoclosmatium sp. JEL0117]